MKANAENLTYEFSKRITKELMKTKTGKKKIFKVMNSIIEDCMDSEIKHLTVSLFNEIRLEDDSKVFFKTK